MKLLSCSNSRSYRKYVSQLEEVELNFSDVYAMSLQRCLLCMHTYTLKRVMWERNQQQLRLKPRTCWTLYSKGAVNEPSASAEANHGLMCQLHPSLCYLLRNSEGSFAIAQ